MTSNDIENMTTLEKMKYYHSLKMTPPEIAKQVGVCPETVRSNLFPGREKRRYNRTIRCVGNNTKFVQCETAETRELKAKITKLNFDIKKHEKTNEKQRKDIEEIIHENGRLTEQNNALEQQLRKIKKEGYQTSLLARKIQNDLLRQLEDSSYELTRTHTETKHVEYIKPTTLQR